MSALFCEHLLVLVGQTRLFQEGRNARVSKYVAVQFDVIKLEKDVCHQSSERRGWVVVVAPELSEQGVSELQRSDINVVSQHSRKLIGDCEFLPPVYLGCFVLVVDEFNWCVPFVEKAIILLVRQDYFFIKSGDLHSAIIPGSPDVRIVA